MKKEVEKAWGALDRIKFLIKTGGLDYDAGHEFASPHLKIINDRGREVSKEHGRPYYPLKFNKMMR